MASSASKRALIPFLVGMMLLTGVCNTIFTKYQDMQCVRNCDAKDPQKHKKFEQPVWQTAQMFVGEAGCFLILGLVKLWNRYVSKRPSSAGYEAIGQAPANAVDGSRGDEDDDALQPGVEPIAKPVEPTDVNRRPLSGWRVLLLAIPATCDLVGTTLMNVGLLFVAASIFQMTRGALVLFVGLFSVLFLKRHLSGYKWLALVIVVAGVAVVGLAGVLEQHKAKLPEASKHSTTELVHRAVELVIRSVVAEKNKPTPAGLTILGIFCIALAQIFTATQFVVEESILHRYSVSPLATVGWEGTFGLIVTLLAQFIAHVAYGRTEQGRGGYFDATTGWQEITHNRSIAVSSLLIMISIGGFNFFGLSVTRTVSATSRSTIDTCRTLFIWVVSLGLGWETFKWLQVVGFAMLVYGTFLFNDLVKPPRWAFWRRDERSSEELLPERPIEHN